MPPQKNQTPTNSPRLFFHSAILEINGKKKFLFRSAVYQFKNFDISDNKIEKRTMGNHFFKTLLSFALFALLAGCAGVDKPRGGDTPNVRKSVVNGLTVSHDYLDDNQYNRRHAMPAPLSQVKTITIHNTAGYLSAKGERDRINSKRDNISVSFHYAVDENEAVQLIPLNIHAWHAGDGAKGEGNLYSISVEICRSLCKGDDADLYARSEANAVILAAWLLNAYNLPVSAMKKHQDWSGKYCPHRILEENRWDSFKKRVAAEMKKYNAR